MKITVLQMTGNILYLTPAKMGRRPVFGKPKGFLFPEELRGRALEEPEKLAAFVRRCLKRCSGSKNILFCMEDDRLVSREYDHMPAKKKFAASFTHLEAETVLQDAVHDYTICSYEYGYQDPQSGKLRAALFAVPKELVQQIKRAFAHNGLKLQRLAPPVTGLLHAAQQTMAEEGRTIALISLDVTYTRLLIFSNGKPVFQRSFVSIFDEITNLIASDLAILHTDAADLILRNGMDASQNGTQPDTERQIKALVDASTGEVIRTIRMVLSSARLEMDKIVVSGLLCELPGFLDYCEALGLDVPVETVDSCCAATGNLPVLETRVISGAMRSGSFFMLNGLLTAQGEEKVDFLSGKNSAQESKINVPAMALVSLAALIIMALKPAMYFVAQDQRARDKATLSDPRYEEIKSLLDRRNQAVEGLSQIKKDRAILPYGQSKTAEVLAQVLDQIDTKVQKINSCQFDSTNGTVALSFVTSSFSDYVALKNEVVENGYFTIAIPFQATVNQEDKTCTCSVTLGIEGYTGYKPKAPPADDGSNLPQSDPYANLSKGADSK